MLISNTKKTMGETYHIDINTGDMERALELTNSLAEGDFEWVIGEEAGLVSKCLEVMKPFVENITIFFESEFVKIAGLSKGKVVLASAKFPARVFSKYFCSGEFEMNFRRDRLHALFERAKIGGKIGWNSIRAKHVDNKILFSIEASGREIKVFMKQYVTSSEEHTGLINLLKRFENEDSTSHVVLPLEILQDVAGMLEMSFEESVINQCEIKALTNADNILKFSTNSVALDGGINIWLDDIFPDQEELDEAIYGHKIVQENGRIIATGQIFCKAMKAIAQMKPFVVEFGFGVDQVFELKVNFGTLTTFGGYMSLYFSPYSQSEE